MPRPRAVVPNRHIHTTLPAELATRLELYLWSESEQRVPWNAIQTFFVQRISEFFSTRTLDLSPYLGSLPGELVVSGNDATISRLITHLKGGSNDPRI
jgi:hypothetical protein